MAKKVPKITVFNNLQDEYLSLRIDGKSSIMLREYWIGNVPPAASKEWERIAKEINNIVNTKQR